MKKIFGILLIVFGSLLSLSISLLFIEFLLRILVNFSTASYAIGYFIGQIIFIVLFGFISFWLIKKGIQLTKNKKEKESAIDKINSIN